MTAVDRLHQGAAALADVAATAVVHGTLLAIAAAVIAATVLRRARPAAHAYSPPIRSWRAEVSTGASPTISNPWAYAPTYTDHAAVP